MDALEMHLLMDTMAKGLPRENQVGVPTCHRVLKDASATEHPNQTRILYLIPWSCSDLLCLNYTKYM